MNPTASDSANDNPLLDFSGLPRFGAFRPEHVTHAIDTLLKQGLTQTVGQLREWKVAI